MASGDGPCFYCHEAKIVESMREEGISKGRYRKEEIFREEPGTGKKQYGGRVVSQLKKIYGLILRLGQERFTYG